MMTLLRYSAPILAISGILAPLIPAQTPQTSTNIQSNVESLQQRYRQPQLEATSGIVPVPIEMGNIVLRPGYLLDMTVFNMPEMGALLRVDGEGNIQVPMVGALH